MKVAALAALGYSSHYRPKLRNVIVKMFRQRLLATMMGTVRLPVRPRRCRPLATVARKTKTQWRQRRGGSMPTATPLLVSSYLSRPAHMPALASPMPHVFKPISMTWKPITGRACCLWAASDPGTVRLLANTRAEKLWTCASADVAWLIPAAICPVALSSVGSRLRTASSRAGAGVIRTMATPRSALLPPPVPTGSASCGSRTAPARGPVADRDCRHVR